LAKQIEAIPKLISVYLQLGKSQYFMIPRYQRGYSWDITNCDELWQNIEDFSSGGDPYFFGTIIIDCSDSEDKEFCLIDGQQRTTTFLLLLKALLLRLNEVLNTIPDDEESISLKEGLIDRRKEIMRILYKAEAEEIHGILRDFSIIKNVSILENNSINETYKNEVKIIINAKDFETAEKNVSKIKYKQKDNRYTNHFRNFKHFYNKLKEKSDLLLNSFAKKFLRECQIIEIRSWQTEQAITMFNSLNSKGLPLSAADIISAKLFDNTGNGITGFDDLWEEIKEQADELESQNIVDINAVLMQFMYINRALNKEYKPNDVTVPGLRNYYIENDYGKKLLADPNEFCKNLLKILEIWKTIRDYPIVKLLLKFNENVKLYLSGYLYRYEPKDISTEEIQAVCECLLRLFAILELVDTGYSSKNFKSFLFNINLKFMDKDIAIYEIIHEFNAHINRNWEKDDLIKEISEYDKNILVFLNDYLYAKSIGEEKKFDFRKNVNIEHIMPGSGRNIDIIRKDAGIASKEEFNNIVNKIGNKILLEEKVNKSIGNEWFKTKKQNTIEEKTGYQKSNFAIAKALTKYPKDTWDKDDIEKATKKASERIIKFIFQT